MFVKTSSTPKPQRRKGKNRLSRTAKRAALLRFNARLRSIEVARILAAA